MFVPESDDHRTIKAMPLWQAFLAAIIGPVIIAVVFGILNVKTNPLLLTLELFLVAIAFCLTGILTRSKAMGFLSFITAPISWAILFVLDMVTAGFIANPYGLFSGLTGPITAIAESGILPALEQYASVITTFAIIIDLAVVEFLAIFLGLYLSTIATGFWTKKGSLSMIAFVSKPLAAIFTIVTLLLVPFAYSGVANLADGGVSLAAGATEFLGAFGGSLGGGSGAQAGIIDLNNPEELEALVKASEKAAQWFKRSQYAFDHVQENFLISFLIDTIFPEGSNLNGLDMRKISLILDISEILASISSELPELFSGYQNLVEGFNLTFNVLSTTDIGGGFGSNFKGIESTYDPIFNTGLKKISDALDNFTDAQTGVVDALTTAKGIITEVIVDESSEFNIISEIIDQADAGYSIILEVARGGIFFLNATYKTTLAIEDLGDSDFSESHTWLADAAIDVSKANTTMNAINTTGLDPNSPLPFWGTVEVIKDMTNLLSWFSMAAANGTDCYTQMSDVLTTIDTLDFTGGGLNTIITTLDQLSPSVTSADALFKAARDNIGNATQLSNSFTEKTYGSIIDGSLKPMLNDFSNMLTQFSTNITEVGYLVTGLTSTVNSLQSFATGFSLFNNSYIDERAAAGANSSLFFTNFNANPNVSLSQTYLSLSIANASAGYTSVGAATVISSDVQTTWQNVLYSPGPIGTLDSGPDPPPTSIAGLAQGV
ncbi:MAG: hypothetical protein ACXACR_11655, partial [Candidatus Hodarchaeales archaeon]